MKFYMKLLFKITACVMLGAAGFIGCSDSGSGRNSTPLNIEPVDPPVKPPVNPPVNLPVNPPDEEYQDIPTTGNGFHPIFKGYIGVPISPKSMGAVDPDEGTLNGACNDYDGDGIKNEDEVISNPYVADYPRIVARITPPVTMIIRVDEDTAEHDYIETLDDQDFKETITNSMEKRQYDQLNKKTTPYVTKEAYSTGYSHAEEYGYSDSVTDSSSVEGSMTIPVYDVTGGFNSDSSTTDSYSENSALSRSFAESSMSETTVFDDVDYIDNLSRNSIEYTNDTVETVSKNFRKKFDTSLNSSIGANAGIVRATFYLKNTTVNIPARVSNVMCSLTYLTPAGVVVPGETFKLLNDDNTEFAEDIYGNEDVGPFTITVENLNTHEIKNALANGYMPQIHVVSYDINRVADSNYNPGVDNLKTVEENAKARTAAIKISGSNMRELYRVTAFDTKKPADAGFDYDPDSASDATIIPGISLKKALFQILKNRTGTLFSNEEKWTVDDNENPLTVADENLRWRTNSEEHVFNIFEDEDLTQTYPGNKWDNFETFIKKYTTMELDTDGNLVPKEHRIETIKRIGDLEKYNPFNIDDNPDYEAGERLSESELRKTKYWVILHNGAYFKGDINDPIWVGDRYEIILVDLSDFQNHFDSYSYTPMQAKNSFALDTRWNILTNSSEFARSVYLGKVVKDDVVELSVDLKESRFLFNNISTGHEFGKYGIATNGAGEYQPGYYLSDFQYTFSNGSALPEGIPKSFKIEEASGGINNIRIKLQNSENAQFYVISIKEAGTSTVKRVRVSPSDLEANNGYVLINRKSKEVNEDGEFTGSDIGEIKGIEGVTNGVVYDVSAYAHGMTHGVPVKTGALNNPDSSEPVQVTVFNPQPEGEPLEYPDNFKAIVNGGINKLTVTIEENSGTNAEYFRVRVYGPFNYGNGNDFNSTDPSLLYGTFDAHAGVNTITIGTDNFNVNNPDGTGSSDTDPVTDEEKNLEVPGVFRVEVYGVNNNTIVDDEEQYTFDYLDNNGVHPAQVHYERYTSQKQFSPVKSSELFDPRAVDLEVNFNEGSGWFRLRLSSDDVSKNGRSIDCRYTTHMEKNKQKVTIKFTPPKGEWGDQNETYNVFRGGNDEVDVYIRTVAKPEYRDTLWVKPGNSGVYVLPDFVNDFGHDIVDWWINNENTDATYIENYGLEGSYFTSSVSVDHGLLGEHDFKFVCSNGKENLFFSPMVNRIYDISAAISEDSLSDILDDYTHVDEPQFTAVRGANSSVDVKNIDSEYATDFSVHIREGIPVVSGDYNLDNGAWTGIGDIHIDDEIGKEYGITYTGNGTDPLPLTATYTVCVIAYNNNESLSSEAKTYKVVSQIPQNSVDMVSASGYSYGASSFYTPAAPMINEDGRELISGMDFYYGNSIEDLYDFGTASFLSSGSVMRISYDGKNIADPSGLNLIPYAYDLSLRHVAPPGNMVYIDPLTGRFCLPRPSYWNRFESADVVNTHEIAEETPAAGTVQLYSGKFNNCIGVEEDADATLNPFGTNHDPITKGTLACWFYVYGAGNSDEDSQGEIYIRNGFVIRLTKPYDEPYCSVKINGISTSSDMTTGWHHLYCIWDNSGELSNGQSLVLFLDGYEIFSSDSTFTIDNTNIFTFDLSTDTFEAPTGKAYIDNLKIWKHVVSESPAWEYYDGTGNEYGLHPVYGSGSNYSIDQSLLTVGCISPK